jgi:hypothetical protein
MYLWVGEEGGEGGAGEGGGGLERGGKNVYCMGTVSVLTVLRVQLTNNKQTTNNGRHNAGGVLPEKAKPNYGLCVYVAADRPACPPPPTSHMMWDSRHFCPLLTLYPPPPTN